MDSNDNNQNQTAETGTENATDLESINQEIYKRNLQLSVTNKTLSLLRQLYQITLLSLDPISISKKISLTIRENLNFEMVGILVFDKEKDSLIPLNFSKSDRLSELLQGLGFLLKDIHIPEVSKHNFFNSIIYKKEKKTTNNIEDIWKGLVPLSSITKIREASHVRTAIAYPLNTENRIIGALLLGLNRDYETLNAYEKDSINSFVDVIAVALDKAYVYKELEDANKKLIEADKMKSQFLSFASHQVKSPMTVVKGYAELIMDGSYGDVPEKVKETAQKIKDSSDHLVALVNNLLDLRKLEEGKIEYRFEKISINDLLLNVAEETGSLAEKKGIEIKTNIPETPIEIYADIEKLRQVFQNLIDNSIKYTEKGFVKIDLDKFENHVQITISDTGIGIPKDILPTLFEQFNRGSKEAKKIQGTGLGLYIAKQFVLAHKGDVRVESKGPGQGSMFIVNLPKK